MKKLKLIYNPYAGDKSFKNFLDEVIQILQVDGNYEVGVYRITNFGDVDKYISTLTPSDVDVLCICGGDGSINLIVNAIKKYEINVPLGIFPCGTANDFCTFLGLPKDPILAAKIIVENNIENIDIGKASDRYFINVACAGLFASISQGVDVDLKNSIGKLAYYINGAKAITNVKPMSVTITTSKGIFEEQTYLVLVMNSSMAGGFTNLAPESSLTDGLLDLVLFKSGPISASAGALIKALSGKHIEDENVLYMQDSYFKIESSDQKDVYPEIDIDGERGPDFPLEIRTIKGGIQIFTPKKTPKKRKLKNVKVRKSNGF